MKIPKNLKKGDKVICNGFGEQVGNDYIAKVVEITKDYIVLDSPDYTFAEAMAESEEDAHQFCVMRNSKAEIRKITKKRIKDTVNIEDTKDNLARTNGTDNPDFSKTY